jgi:hypothetical protein
MTDTNSTVTLLQCEPFTRHTAYTLWRLEVNPNDPNKPPVKVPVHYDGITRHSTGNEAKGIAPNPAPPLTAAQAVEWLAYHHAAGTGHARRGEVGYLGAGFRPAGTGLVCVDLDDCITAEGWTPGALALMQRFPGALVEQSVGGSGAHLWFSVTGAGPGKKTKQKTPLGAIEVYSEGQFIACGTVLGGDARTDHTAAIGALVAEFWPGSPAGLREDRALPNDWEEKTPEQRAQTVAELRDALAKLDSDDNHEWTSVGYALSSLGEVGYQLWAEWSATSSRFPGGDGLHQWDRFHAQRTDYRSIFNKAEASGWVNPARRPALGAAESLFGADAGPYAALPPGAVTEPPPSRVAAAADLSFMSAAAGVIPASLAKVAETLASPESGVQLRYDSFKDDNYISIGGEPWRPVTDADIIDLRIRFERRGFKPVSADCMNDAIRAVCELHKVDSAKDWAAGLVWDGVPRIDTVLPVYYGTVDTPYTRAAGAYLFTALGGRALVPGIKADMALILVGVQGAGKTTSVEVLSPDPANFGEVDLSKKDADLARSLRGKQVMELAELQGLSGRALEATKAWLSRKTERWVPKFQEREIEYARRMIVVGTTNEEEFLDDPTGERRTLPVKVGTLRMAELREVCVQLWAEGVARFRANGIEWQAAQELAKAEHGQYKVHDDWQERIAAWLDEVPPNLLNGPVHTEKRATMPLILADILTGAVGMLPAHIDMKASKRASKIMKSLGYVRSVSWQDGKTIRRWVKG